MRQTNITFRPSAFPVWSPVHESARHPHKFLLCDNAFSIKVQFSNNATHKHP
jgi:hypothetical protein